MEVNYVVTSHRTDFATITFNGNGLYTHTMYFSEDQVRAGMDGTNKTSGFAVRCVLPVND